MGVATNRVWVDKLGAKQESAEFHNIVMWGKLAETAASFLQKGTTVLVEGRLETRSWQDKDANNRKVTEIVAENVQFGARPAAAGAQASTPTKHVAPKASTEEPVINLDGDEENTGRSMTGLFSEGKVEDEDIPF